MPPFQKISAGLALATLVALSGCSKQEATSAAPAAAPAATTPSTQATASAAAPAPADDKGKAVYAKTCALCHASGVAGAPKPGDKADWGPRIAQGNDTLYKHALEGFTGAKGAMPARGGGASLSDDEVKSAVDFMTAQSR